MRRSAPYRVIAWVSLLLLALAIPAGARSPVPAPAPDLTGTTYRVDVAFDPALGTIEGTERIDWVNDTGATQREIYLRVYPNASHYHGGSLSLWAISVKGRPVDAGYGSDPTIARLPLPAPVAAGERATVALTFRTAIPRDSAGNAGMLQLDTRTGIWALADWYPIVAGYEPGAGWYLAPPNALGDPTFSDVAVYDVRLTMPPALAVAGTGVETGNPVPAGDGRVTRRFTTRVPAREFGLAIGAPGQTMTRRVDGVTIRVMLLGDPFGGEALVDQVESVALDAAAAAFAAYTRWFGPYDQPDLDITFLSLTGALGVSMSGVAWIDAPGALADDSLSVEERAALAFTVGHEVGHQWLIGIIGSNNNRYGFLSEGLVQSLTPAALSEDPGAASADSYWRRTIGGEFLPPLQAGEDGVVDRDVSAREQSVSRTALIYGKAPLGFVAICQRIGPDAYFAGLRAYGQRFWFGVSTPADLRQALEDAAHAHGEDPALVGVLWDYWFEQADTTVAEVNAVLDQAESCSPAA